MEWELSDIRKEGGNYKDLISGMWTKTFPLFKIFNFSILLFRSLELHAKPRVKITKIQL